MATFATASWVECTHYCLRQPGSEEKRAGAKREEEFQSKVKEEKVGSAKKNKRRWTVWI